MDGHNNGLDNVIPYVLVLNGATPLNLGSRHVLENAKGFALFTVMKGRRVFRGDRISHLQAPSWIRVLRSCW